MIFDAIIYVALLAAVFAALGITADWLDQHYPLHKQGKTKVL